MLQFSREQNKTVVTIRGELTREATYEPLTEWVKKQTDPFILDVDSCGGDVIGLASCCDAISSSGLALAHVSGVAASAAFFLAIACDHIECVEDGKVGSLGTMMVCGEKPSGYHNSRLSPRKNAEDEQIEDILDNDASRLLKFVSLRRGFNCDNVAQIAKICGEGKLMSAQEALERGLIDVVLPCFKGELTMAKNNKSSFKTLAKNKCEEFEGEPTPEETVKEQELTVDDLIAKRDQLLMELEELNNKIAELQPSDEVIEEEMAEGEEEEYKEKEEVKETASFLRRLERLERAAKRAALADIPLSERARASVLYDGEMKGEHKLFSKHYSSFTRSESRISNGDKVEPDRIDRRSDFEKIKDMATASGSSFTDTLFRMLSK